MYDVPILADGSLDDAVEEIGMNWNEMNWNWNNMESETGCRRRCETRRPRFATQILDAFWKKLSHHMIRESCLSPGCFFGTEENAFCPLSHQMIREWCLSPGCFFGTGENAFVHYLTIWFGSHVYHPDAFLGLKKMHFVHWLGSDVYHPDAFLGRRKMHFVHYLTIWLGSDVYHPDAFWDWGKCILSIISPYD